MARKKITQCSRCRKNSSEVIEEKEFKKSSWSLKHAEKVDKILKNNKTAYEKEIILSNGLKSLNIGKLQPEEKQRVNSLLLSRFYMN